MHLEQKVLKGSDGSRTLGNFTSWCAFLESFALITIVPKACRCQPQCWYIVLLFAFVIVTEILFNEPRPGMVINEKDQDFEFDTQNSTRGQH